MNDTSLLQVSADGAVRPGHGEADPGSRPAREQIEEGLKAHPAKKGLPFSLLVTAVEVGGSLGLFHLASSLGAGPVASYLAGSVAPLAGGLMIWVRARKFSGASAAIFAFTFVSAGAALAGSTSPRVLLYKDCAATALVGLVFLGSCLARKPVTFYLAQRFSTDGTHEGMSAFEAMWDAYDRFRRGMYLISFLWAALFLVQAAVTALIIAQASYGTAYDFDQALPYVAAGLGVAGSMVIGRLYARRGPAGPQ